jgi:hypothetical protein
MNYHVFHEFGELNSRISTVVRFIDFQPGVGGQVKRKPIIKSIMVDASFGK